jgi:threonine/homoserine/homoserine lactone efflux protein
MAGRMSLGPAMATLLVSGLAYLFGLFGSIPPAGPIAVLIVSRGAERRYQSALRIGLGAAVVEGVYAFISFWGFATFLARREVVLPISHAVTLVVLGTLGIRFMMWKDEQNAAHADGDPAKGFWFGFSISALNPTLLATWSTATAALYSHKIFAMRGYMAIPFALAASAGVATWALLTVRLLERYGERFPRHALTLAVRGMGLVLFAVAIWSGINLAGLLLHRDAHG